MSWFKVDDQFWSHPKASCLTGDALALWLRAGCWSAQYLTDGFVPRGTVGMFYPCDGDRLAVDMQDAAMELVDAGLWFVVEGGYSFHDWSDYQPSSDQVKATREARAQAGSRGGQAKALANGKQSASKPSGKAEAKVCPVPGPVPVPIEQDQVQEHLPIALRATGEFDAFWAAYPRKAGKRNARTAYERALKRGATHDGILAGLRSQTPSWTDPRYIPHPTTWLNRDGWEDDPCPTGALAPVLDLAQQAARLDAGQRFF